MGYLLDTNAVIKYLDASLTTTGMQLLNVIVDGESKVSIITKMEALGYNFRSMEEQITMEAFINGSTVLDLNNDIANRTIALRKSKKMKLPDAIIAATALVYGLVLITSNIYDFRDIDRLMVNDLNAL